MSNITLFFIFGGVVVLLLALLVTTLFLHKKSASHQLKVIGAVGIVETQLDPEGAVIVNGELWRARLNDATSAIGKSKVRVVGTQGHLLLVEPATDHYR